MSVKFDWTAYVDEQLRWADTLITQATTTPGHEGDKLLATGMCALAEATRLMELDLESDRPVAPLFS